MAQEATYPIKATKTSFEILELLSESGPMGVTDIASYMDISKSSVHNHLSTLYEIDYVTKVNTSYDITYQPFELGHTTRTQDPVYQVARDHINNLVKTTSETVVLAIRENDFCTVISTASGSDDLTDVLFPGKKLPLHATAPGKAILAQLAEDLADEPPLDELSRLTPKTITDVDQLRDHLTSVLEDGIGYEKGEYREGLYGVGAPIVATDQQRHYALAVCGPESRLSGRRLEEDITGQVISSVNAIEVELQSE